MCCDSLGCKELDMTERLSGTEHPYMVPYIPDFIVQLVELLF